MKPAGTTGGRAPPSTAAPPSMSAIVGPGTPAWGPRTAHRTPARYPDRDRRAGSRRLRGVGRNGGFCSALFPTSLRRLAKGGTREAADALQRTMNDAVGHIGEV